jgi:hypothetical protein
MLTYKVQSTLEKLLKPLNPYIINTKLIVTKFVLTRHIQFVSNILFCLCCLFKLFLCIQFNFFYVLLALVKKKINVLQNDTEDIKADNSSQLRNDAGRLARKVFVGLVPHLNPSRP